MELLLQLVSDLLELFFKEVELPLSWWIISNIVQSVLDIGTSMMHYTVTYQI